MTSNQRQSHPSALLPIYIAAATTAHRGDFTFEFSKYVYIPQTVVESRKIFGASPERIAAVFQLQAKTLANLEEIAFHSRIEFSANNFAHIPMIDMGCANIERHLPELKAAFLDFGIDHFTVYHSGRSFHIYGHSLLKNDLEHVRFMGRMLLLNLPGQEHVIDERWVGHRLMAGYSTLRWTNNNPHYKSAPVKYGEY